MAQFNQVDEKYSPYSRIKQAEEKAEERNKAAKDVIDRDLNLVIGTLKILDTYIGRLGAIDYNYKLAKAENIPLETLALYNSKNVDILKSIRNEIINRVNAHGSEDAINILEDYLNGGK